MAGAYEIVKIGENAWRIEENGVRALLFVGTKSALLVDTGFGNGDLRAEVEALTALPIILVNTHADGDHTGNNAQFGPANMSPSEYAYYFEKAAPDAPVAPLWEGETIDLGGRAFEVLTIPGHTPGSVALLDRENRVLVAGDSVSASPIFMFGAHRNIRAFIASMERLLKYRDDIDEIYPAHGPCPLPPDSIEKVLNAAIRVRNGEIEPQEPPFPLPAKLYQGDGAALFA